MKRTLKKVVEDDIVGSSAKRRLAKHSKTASAHPKTHKFGYPIYHPLTRQDWRLWLEQNHKTEKGVWFCSWKATTKRAYVSYVDAVMEALCFGWIDSTKCTLDDDRTLQLMTPRKGK
jgi:uncharacterized protein YdeI (YjbR/CyaY-like superfamily)